MGSLLVRHDDGRDDALQWERGPFFLCHRHWDLDNLLHLALKNALLRDHLWPLHNFLLLMWDVKVHNHFLLDMVMTMVVHDKRNTHNLFLCHRDWHFNYMLALSMDNLFLLADLGHVNDKNNTNNKNNKNNKNN